MDMTFGKIFRSVSWYKRLILWVLVFLQFYPVWFITMPMSMRVVVSFMGIGLWVLQVLSYQIPKKHTIVGKKRFIVLFIPLILMMFVSIYSVNLNATDDTTFVYYFQTPLLMLSSAYFIVFLLHFFYKDKLSFPIIAYYCIGAVFFQLCLGIAMFYNSGLKMFLLLKTKEGVMQLHNMEAGRFLGFGSFFMNLGVANGVGLLLLGLMLKNAKIYHLSRWDKVKMSFFLIFIAVLGLFQARTTMFCDVIMLAFMSFSSLQLNYGMMKVGILRVVRIVLITVLLGISIVALFPEFFADQTNSMAIGYGFEMFESANNGTGMKTKSSDLLRWMLTIWPTTTKTWLIGDGKFEGFYMRTDVGYARLVFYFGIFGMFLYYIYTIYVIWCSFYKITRLSIAFCIYFTLMVLLINVKSFTEYTHYVGVFFMFKLLYPELVRKGWQIISPGKEVEKSISIDTKQLQLGSA